MRRTGLAAVVVVVALAALALGGCGGGSGGADAEGASPVKRPSADPPNFHQTEYDLETTWKQAASDKKEGGYLVSVWYDSAVPEFKMRVASRPSDGTAPPLASAELARLQVSSLPGYKEHSFAKIKTGGHPVIRWTYTLGDINQFAYFFAECGVSISMQGPGPFDAGNFAYFYDNVISGIKPVCDE
jgi:hypothetical protein